MKTDMIVKTGMFVALTVLLSYIFAIHKMCIRDSMCSVKMKR